MSPGEAALRLAETGKGAHGPPRASMSISHTSLETLRLSVTEPALCGDVRGGMRGVVSVAPAPQRSATDISYPFMSSSEVVPSAMGPAHSCAALFCV